MVLELTLCFTLHFQARCFKLGLLTIMANLLELDSHVRLDSQRIMISTNQSMSTIVLKSSSFALSVQ